MDHLIMKIGFVEFVTVILLALLCSLDAAFGIRITINEEECLSHYVTYEGESIHVSFVVIKSDSGWHANHEGVDLVVKGPSDEKLESYTDTISEKFELIPKEKGAHRFCFTNRSPYQETLEFDVHENHLAVKDQHAKDEHFDPLLEQISKLEEALYSIQFEQHWLEAQTERQALVNRALNRQTFHKALIESAALIGVSLLQVYLLRRLFNRKLGISRLSFG